MVWWEGVGVFIDVLRMYKLHVCIVQMSERMSSSLLTQQHARTRFKASNYYKQHGLNSAGVRWRGVGPTGPGHSLQIIQKTRNTLYFPFSLSRKGRDGVRRCKKIRPRMLLTKEHSSSMRIG